MNARHFLSVTRIKRLRSSKLLEDANVYKAKHRSPAVSMVDSNIDAMDKLE